MFGSRNKHAARSFNTPRVFTCEGSSGRDRQRDRDRQRERREKGRGEREVMRRTETRGGREGERGDKEGLDLD